MSTALVTGGAGFIGAHLARDLVERGYRVDLVDNFSRGASDAALRALVDSGRVRLLSLDVRDREALRTADGDYRLVFHLAAIVGVANVLERPYDVLAENVRMLLAVIDLARALPHLERLVFTSTSEVYAGTLEHFDLPVPTPEAAPLALTDLGHPRTSYLLSKIYGEALCRHSGLPVTIVRPHNVYGPRMGLAHVIPELLERAHAAPDGGALEVYSVDHRRTFCHVDDAVELIRRAAESPACAGETLNVGRQEPEVRIGELAALVARAVGKRLEIVPLPPTPGSPARRAPEMTKTVSLTGHEPAVDLEEGLARTYAWYRANVFERPGAYAR